MAGRLRVLLLTAAALGALLGPAGGAETEFSFSRLDGTHVFGEVATAPSAWGPLNLRLRAKDAQVRVLSHRVVLSPLEDGTHQARFAARVEGTGAVFAEVTVLGFADEQADHVTLPPQDQNLAGRVRLGREGDVYRVTTVEVPRQVTVRMQSRLGERLAQWCEGIPLLESLGGDCGGLRKALSSATVSLPRAGETYEIRRDELTEPERQALDRYLAQAPQPR